MKNILKDIYRAGLKLLVPFNLQETYAHIVKEAKKLCRADYGSIFLYQNGQLERVYTTFPILSQVALRPKGFTYNAFKKRKSFIVDIKYRKNINPKIKKLGIKSDLLAPLFYRHKSIGVLSLLSQRSDHFTNEHLDAMKLFAAMATLAIIKAQSYDEIKEALNERDLFISMAAHELRTPITTINGYIQLLYSKLSGSNASESRWVEELFWEGDRLTKLVNELLTVDRIKAGQLRYSLRECGLKGIIKRAMTKLRFTHPDHKVIFQDKLAESKDMVIGDDDKLLQVIINILDNAAKFSSPGSEIHLALRFKSPFFLLTIKDQGQGIAKKDLPAVFEGFYRGKNSTKEGMGLGLFLAKNIIQHHRGTITIHSKENQGTTVLIKLPRVKT